MWPVARIVHITRTQVYRMKESRSREGAGERIGNRESGREWHTQNSSTDEQRKKGTLSMLAVPRGVYEGREFDFS